MTRRLEHTTSLGLTRLHPHLHELHAVCPQSGFDHVKRASRNAACRDEQVNLVEDILQIPHEIFHCIGVECADQRHRTGFTDHACQQD